MTKYFELVICEVMPESIAALLESESQGNDFRVSVMSSAEKSILAMKDSPVGESRLSRIEFRLLEHGPGQVRFWGECDDLMADFVLLKIKRIKELWPKTREITPWGIEREDALTWADPMPPTQARRPNGAGGDARMIEKGDLIDKRELPLDQVSMAKFTGLLASLDDCECEHIGSVGELQQWHVKHLTGKQWYITALPIGKVLQVKFYCMPYDVPHKRRVIKDASGAEWESAEDQSAFGEMRLVPGCDDEWESERALASGNTQVVEIFDAALPKWKAEQPAASAASDAPTTPTSGVTIIAGSVNIGGDVAGGNIAKCGLGPEGTTAQAKRPSGADGGNGEPQPVAERAKTWVETHDYTLADLDESSDLLEFLVFAVYQACKRLGWDYSVTRQSETFRKIEAWLPCEVENVSFLASNVDIYFDSETPGKLVRTAVVPSSRAYGLFPEEKQEAQVFKDTVGELEPSLSRSEFTGYASDIFPLGIRPERGLLRLAR